MAVLDHIGVWTNDLESMREFYTVRLGGVSGALYENPKTGFRSYFISFGAGARVELMNRPDISEGSAPSRFGLAHLALTWGSRDDIDSAIQAFEAQGVPIHGRPRLTGDGYYEAVIRDPEGNLIELVAVR